MAVLLLAVGAEAHAVDRYWGNQFGGSFNSGANWQGSVVAGEFDVAHFGKTENPIFQQEIYEVGFFLSATNQALKIEDDFVTFDLNGLIYTTTLATGNEIGNVAGRAGALTVTNGFVIVPFLSELSIGAATNASGLLTVSTGGKVIGNPTLLVGQFGTGFLIAQNGGDILTEVTNIGNNAGVFGTATITGAGSALVTNQLNVGKAGSGTLNLAASGQVESVEGVIGQVAGSTGTVNVDGANSQWMNSGDLRVGDSGQGALSITAGGRVQNTIGFICYEASSISTVTVDGANSKWINSSVLQVGLRGQGTLDIAAGGLVESTEGNMGIDGGTGTVTVDGANSQWINSSSVTVGLSGNGALNITGGGTVQNTSGFVGDLLDTTGTVTVAGANSQWVNSADLTVGNVGTGTLIITDGGSASVTDQLTVGDRGPGTLNITVGGRADSNDGFVGRLAGSTGTVNVDGANSQWMNSGDLSVGGSGQGTLNITAGGQVQNTTGFISFEASSTGTVIVDGANSQWINSNVLQVGLRGQGTLNITAGGLVQNTEGNIGVNGGTGTVTVDGANSQWINSGALNVGLDGNGTLNITGGGTVSVAQGVVLFPQGLVRLQGGTLDTSAISFQGVEGTQFQWTSGTLHVEAFVGSLLNQGGTLAPGHSAGSTIISGDYTQQSAGTMEIEIGGPAQGAQFDYIHVNSIALVDGELELKLINGFLPTSSQTFLIFDALDLLGSFDNAANGQRLGTVDCLGSFLVHYGLASPFAPSAIVLSDFKTQMPGDVNFDGAVDIFDINLVSAHWGEAGPAGDANCDGTVDIFDVNLISSNWGAGGVTAVPEPSTLALLLAGGLLLASRRRSGIAVQGKTPGI